MAKSRKIITSHVYPPIPMRNFDWCAYDDDLHPDGPQGWGSSERAAVDDLMEQLKEDQGEADPAAVIGPVLNMPPLPPGTTVPVMRDSIPFASAFATARQMGAGRFVWQGRPYHTRTDEEVREGKRQKPRDMCNPHNVTGWIVI